MTPRSSPLAPDTPEGAVDPPAAAAPALSPGPIAYVVKMFPRLSETFIANEVMELSRRGVDLRLVSLMRPTGSVQSEEARALARETHILPQPGEPGARRAILRAHGNLARRAPRRYFRTLALVGRRFSGTAWKRFAQAGPLAVYCRQERVSHVHAGFAHAPASVAWWVHRLTGIPFSFAAHAKDLYLSQATSLRHKMDAARFVWTCTEANGAHLRSLGSPTPVVVGYHGSDLTRLRPVSSEPENSAEPTILAVGRLVPKKGLDDLIRAAALLRDCQVPHRVEIVGDGAERAALEALAERLGVSASVRFAGSLPPEEVRRRYSRASVVALPSIVLENGDRDGIPNVLVEAMAMKVPVVSTRVSAIPELIRHGETGLLVEPRRCEALAEALRDCLRRPEEAAERAQRAYDDVRARFDLHRNSEPLAALLQRHRRPTRCLYVNADLGIPVRGHKGASAHVRQVVRAMQISGLEVRLVAAASGPEPPEGNAFDARIVEAPPPAWMTRLVEQVRGPGVRGHLRELRRLLHNLPLGRTVRAILREWKPDFVYERYALCSFATGLCCRVAGVPWLLEVNAPLAEEEARFRDLRWKRLTRLLERSILRRADRVFVVSPALERWACELGVDPDRVSVLGNGVDRARFHPGIDGAAQRRSLEWTDSETVVAFAGSLKPWHGVEVLMKAFALAAPRNPALRLLVIGDGPERRSLERRAERLGVAERVVFTGAVPQDRVPELLRAADLLVAPYAAQDRFYFSPLKVLEYLAVGRPVIASDTGSLPDLVDASCGRLVRPGDVQALRRAVEELARSPELRRALGAGAALRAEGQDWTDRVAVVLDDVERIRRGERLARPRVGYVLKMFPRFSETFVINEILELERQRLQIRVFSMKRPTGRRQTEADRVRARAIVLPSWGRVWRPAVLAAHAAMLLRRPVAYPRALAFAIGRRDLRALHKFAQAGVIANACRRERIGHLHAHFASGPARVAKMASMISGVPFSFTAHAKDIYWEGHRHAESHKMKKRTRLARFVVTVSRENLRHLESLGFKIKEGKVRPVYIGLPLGRFPFRPPSGRPRTSRPLILAVGRLVEKKGFAVLLEALAKLRAEDLRFRCLIAGDGPQRAELEQAIDRLGLRGWARLIGEVPLERLRERYYSRARILALPCVVAADGDRDGIPTVLLEAMALGVPIVTTPVSGIPEAIDDEVDGLFAPPGDADSLARQLGRVLRDGPLAEELALRGRERVERQFNLKANAGSLRKLFLRSLRGWPPVEAAPEEATAPESTSAPPASEPLAENDFWLTPVDSPPIVAPPTPHAAGANALGTS